MIQAKSAKGWIDMRTVVTEVALDGPWVVGDWLNDAEKFGLEERRVEELNSDPRWEGTRAGELMFVARRFRRSQRTHRVPWEFYAAVGQLPDVEAGQILALAARERWALSEVKKATSRAKAEAKKTADV